MVAQIITSAPELSISAVSEGILEAAVAGGRALLRSSANLLGTKSDGSPVTAADIASDEAIRTVLGQRFPSICVISEETANAPPAGFEHRPFFLVDPLDGTKEFISGHEDFAICIALIKHRRPVAGVILAPAARQAWVGAEKAEELRLDEDLGIATAERWSLPIGSADVIPTSVITSRSHTDARSARLVSSFPEARHVAMGAALKFAAVARGDACLYPRGAGSMEWDIAAGEAILMAVGGYMTAESGQPIQYGNHMSGFRNGPFIAGRNREMVVAALAQWAAF